MEAFLILPFVVLLPAGFLAGAAIAHYLGGAFAWGLAVSLGMLAGGLLALGRMQPPDEAIGHQIVALTLAAPLAVGAALGAWLVLRNRR